MGWAIGGLGVFIVLLLAAGASLIICKRYPVNWQCNPRDVWFICEDWRRKLSWLWAPREEKVGLVKAQHPTAQVPGLYRQSSTSSSQYILTSDGDLRLDAREGAFTRFESVDKDVHPAPVQPPVGPLAAVVGSSSSNEAPSAATAAQSSASASNIPPQPLRPAPQPRATARPRPSPLRTELLRQRECEPSPLTPPPAQFLLGKFNSSSARGTVFHFQHELPPPPLPPPPAHASLSMHRTSPAMIFNNHSPFHSGALREPTCNIRYSVQGTALCEGLFDEKGDPDGANEDSPPYGSYDIVHQGKTNYDSLYSAQDAFMHRVQSNRNLEDLERIARYIQSLPDVAPATSPTLSGGRNYFFDDRLADNDEEEVASPAAPPPPAPPDPGPEQRQINNIDDYDDEDDDDDDDDDDDIRVGRRRGGRRAEPTTGEKIFKALRAVTKAQNYIDANEFYNSILSSAQQVQNLVTSQAVMESKRLNNSRATSPYEKMMLAPRASDLFSPELNQEAQRTAQQVSNSLQDPPASPLLMKDLDQQAYNSYLSDPSFTRTSEEIFNSLEQRRKSVQERMNGFQELLEHEAEESERRRSSQEFLNVLEEVQMKRRLSQVFEDVGQENGEIIVPDILGELVNGSCRSRRSSLEISFNFDDMSSLQRAISCESVCSDTSVVLNDLEAGDDERQTVGLICIGLEHDRWPGHVGETDLLVSVLEARDLTVADGSPAQNTFARVYLLPDRQAYAQTRVYKDTNCPSYQENFSFPLDGGSAGRSLLVEVYSYELPNESSADGEATILGEANLRLDQTPRPPATTSWLSLLSPAPQLGALLFSLSYLPTAERLTLVVVKAVNLRGANENSPGDFFVKIYLLQQGKKMHKKRTSIKRGEKSPIFNEAIIFKVPAHSLQNIQLRLTVAEVSGDLSNTSKAYSVGHIIVGASSTGRAGTHWRQMLAALRRPAPMWHSLRK
ncbi:uncharacterized protein LOC106649010 [Trichogramma pretiosum]|uniref:uncharacterized protein LOC106649010 n=1 Tax=Trichogramma pretiosum TaxID=7493 RepID=UPI0006C94CBC|nr:uncharacterized protein LOC106649010 [Trichogramma pretiosum]